MIYLKHDFWNVIETNGFPEFEVKKVMISRGLIPFCLLCDLSPWTPLTVLYFIPTNTIQYNTIVSIDLSILFGLDWIGLDWIGMLPPPSPWMSVVHTDYQQYLTSNSALSVMRTVSCYCSLMKEAP